MRLFFPLFFWCGMTVYGQIGQPLSIQNSAGGRASSVGFTTVTAVGQPTAGINRSGQLVNYVGFIQATPLKPQLDHDQDGLPDEFDSDNDNDALTDLEEIEGSRFTPATPTDVNQADSDDDGFTDGAEWTADTHPTNATSRLAITGISPQGAGIQVVWGGGVNARQFLMRSDNLTAATESWQAIFTNEPPTLMLTNTVDVATNRGSFYKIKAERP